MQGCCRTCYHSKISTPRVRNMPVTRKVLIGLGSVLLLVGLVAVITAVSFTTAGLKQNCPSDVKPCETAGGVYHVESGKCFAAGDTPEGICGRNMAIFPDPTCMMKGYCECNYEEQNRTLVYNNQTRNCHFLYTQAFCPEGQVLTPSKVSPTKFQCQLDACGELKSQVQQDERDLIVPYGDKCYTLYSNQVPNCKGTLRFWKGKIKPSCTPPSSFRQGSIGSPAPPPCPSGSVRAQTGECHGDIVDLDS